MSRSLRNVLWFNEVDKDDGDLVGGKGANLGEMTQAGFPVPNGFIITSRAYKTFIKENNLEQIIKHLLATANYDKPDSLNQVSAHIKEKIRHAKPSPDLISEIFKAYSRLGEGYVAVRSSATAEDLPGASFAGQQETYLNVKGEANLMEAVKDAWSSLFNARAIFYRHEKKFDHFKVGIALPVQKMVDSEKSGIMFTQDPVTNDKKRIVIEAIYGLGELIVQGEVTPDHYEVSKEDNVILIKDIKAQKKMMIRKAPDNAIVSVKKKDEDKQKITDEHIKILAKLGKKLEEHYYFPQDSEWAIEKGKVYIVQTRPITTINNAQSPNAKEEKTIHKPLAIPHSPILRGAPASPGIASGKAVFIKNAKEIGLIEKGDVLVAPQTNPDYVPAMKKAAAIVTEAGGRTSHAAIVSRELGIPAVVGAEHATKLLKKNLVITVNGSTGEVFKGAFASGIKSSRIVPSTIPLIRTHTKVYVNLAEPERAKEVSTLPVGGIGLLRAEFMMAQIGTHPKQMIKEKRQKEFVKQLSDGLEQFCGSFYPRPVVYRASDFKTNEYRNLKGGSHFEPIEPNPMLGYRGAFRYMNDPEVFKLELEAIKYIREKRKLTNLWMMVPFVRTVKELIEVKKLISSSGLYRSETFKLWMMVEIPSNVILLDKFLYTGIDGVSIGSNDLTMLLLGTDRDNSEVASEFDEQNDAVLWALERVIKTCHKYKVTSSICGQAPSLYPRLVEKLVEWGITSVSVSPDAAVQVRNTIKHLEQTLLHSKS